MDNETALKEVNRNPIIRFIITVKRLIVPTIFIVLVMFIGTVLYCQHVTIISQQAIIDTQRHTIESLVILSYSKNRMDHERKLEMVDDLAFLNRFYGKFQADDINLKELFGGSDE